MEQLLFTVSPNPTKIPSRVADKEFSGGDGGSEETLKGWKGKDNVMEQLLLAPYAVTGYLAMQSFVLQLFVNFMQYFVGVRPMPYLCYCNVFQPSCSIKMGDKENGYKSYVFI